MNDSEQYLLLAYFLSRNQPGKNCDSKAIHKLLPNIPNNRLKAIVFQLSEEGYILTDKGFGDKFVVSALGVNFAERLILERDIFFLQFISARYVPPTDKLMFNFIYN